MRQREDWRQPAHRPGDCVAGVPEEILDRYAEEGPALERRGELPPVPEPTPEDFENREAYERHRRQGAAS
jgi:hypothetical protein